MSVREYTEADTVEFNIQGINRCSQEEFKKLGSTHNIKDIFFDEIQVQKREKQDKIKENAPDLYHFSKINLNNEPLKAMRWRPDLAQEEMFLGVCAAPDNKGTYTLKEEGKESRFIGSNLVILYQEPPEDDAKIIGYGYKVNKEEFSPTVSNQGEYLDEWTARNGDVGYSEVIEVSMQYLRENGVQIFYADKGAKKDINKIIKENSIDASIAKLKEFAQGNEDITDYNQMIIDKENPLKQRIDTLKKRLGVQSILQDTSAQQNQSKDIDYTQFRPVKEI